MTSSASFVELLKAARAIDFGHYDFAGIHSSILIDKHRLQLLPRLATQGYMAIAGMLADAHPDMVVGPATGGTVMAFDIARYLGCRFLYHDLNAGVSIAEYWQDYDLEAPASIVLVDDIVVTGRTLARLQSACSKAGLVSLASASLITYPEARASAIPHYTLAPDLIEEWQPSSCPLCRECIPLESIR